MKGPVLQDLPEFKTKLKKRTDYITLKRVVNNATYTKEVTDGQIVRRLRRIAIVVLENLLA